MLRTASKMVQAFGGGGGGGLLNSLASPASCIAQIGITCHESQDIGRRLE